MGHGEYVSRRWERVFIKIGVTLDQLGAKDPCGGQNKCVVYGQRGFRAEVGGPQGHALIDRYSAVFFHLGHARLRRLFARSHLILL